MSPTGYKFGRSNTASQPTIVMFVVVVVVVVVVAGVVVVVAAVTCVLSVLGSL